MALRWLTLLVVVAAGIPAVASAQGGGAARAEHRSNPLGQSLYWLLTPQIRQELEIIPEQVEMLTKIQRESQAKMTEAYKKVAEVPAEERQQKYFEIYRKLNEETEDQVREVLLPMQVKRLKQILLQTKLQQLQWGGANAFVGDELAEELEITSEQKAQFAEKEKELRAEIQKKTQEFYKQLQEDSRAKLLEVLTPEQRQKLDALTGPKYEWKYEQPGGSVQVDKK